MKNLNRVLVYVVCCIIFFTAGSVFAADAASDVCYIGDSAETGQKFTSVKAAIESLGSCNKTTIHLLCDTNWDGMTVNGGEDFAIDGTNPGGSNYTVTLLGDVTVTGYSTRAYFSNVTIDLNQHHFNVTGNSDMYLESGSVLKNGYDSVNGGGAAFVQSSGFYMYEGSVVENCSAKGHGGAFRLVGLRREFEMTGGIIRNCSAGNKGGAISAVGDASTVKLTGGEISGNSAVNGGGGVYVEGDSTVKLSGSIKISGNTLSDETTVNNMEVASVSNLQINGAVTENVGITCTGATKGTEIGTVSQGVTDISKIKYDNSDYKVALSEGKLVLMPDYVCYLGDNEATGKKYKTLGEALSSKSGTSVTIRLIQDVELAGMDIKNNTDFKIIGTNAGGQNFTVKLLGDVNITEYSDNGTLENVTFNLNGHHISIKANLTLTLNAGAILENGQGNPGGAVFIQTGTLTMNSGSIVRNCTSTGDGGAFALNGGTFNMNGGEITGCVAATNGGAISLSRNASTVTLSGGSISRNKAANGGGIYVKDDATSNVVKTSGSASVTGNTVTSGSTASNVTIAKASAFNVTGAQTGKIGVTFYGEGSALGTVTQGITFANSNTVSYDDDSFIIYIDGTELKRAVKPALSVLADSGVYSDETGIIRFLSTFTGVSGESVEKYGTYALATDAFDMENDKSNLTKFVDFTVTPATEKAFIVDVVDVPEDKLNTKVMGVSFVKIKGIDTPFYFPYAECVSVNSINPEVKNLGNKVSE